MFAVDPLSCVVGHNQSDPNSPCRLQVIRSEIQPFCSFNSHDDPTVVRLVPMVQGGAADPSLSRWDGFCHAFPGENVFRSCSGYRAF